MATGNTTRRSFTRNCPGRDDQEWQIDAAMYSIRQASPGTPLGTQVTPRLRFPRSGSWYSIAYRIGVCVSEGSSWHESCEIANYAAGECCQSQVQNCRGTLGPRLRDRCNYRQRSSRIASDQGILVRSSVAEFLEPAAIMT